MITYVIMKIEPSYIFQHFLLIREVFIIHTRYLDILNLKNPHKKSQIGNPFVEHHIIQHCHIARPWLTTLSLHKMRAQCWRDQWLIDTIIIVSQGTYPTRVFTGYVLPRLFLSWIPSPQRVSVLYDYSNLGCPTSSSKSIGCQMLTQSSILSSKYEDNNDVFISPPGLH